MFVALRNILIEDSFNFARSLRLSFLVMSPVNRTNRSGLLLELINLVTIDLHHFCL